MSVDFLDTALDKAVDKIMLHYAESEFYEELGEKYTDVLKMMIRDGIKVGIALNSLVDKSLSANGEEGQE